MQSPEIHEFERHVRPHVEALSERVGPLHGRCDQASLLLHAISRELLHQHIPSTRGHGIELHIGTVLVDGDALWDSADSEAFALQVIGILQGHDLTHVGAFPCHFWLRCNDVVVDYTLVATMAFSRSQEKRIAILAGRDPLHLDPDGQFQVNYVPFAKILLDERVSGLLARRLSRNRAMYLVPMRGAVT